MCQLWRVCCLRKRCIYFGGALCLPLFGSKRHSDTTDAAKQFGWTKRCDGDGKKSIPPPVERRAKRDSRTLSAPFWVIEIDGSFVETACYVVLLVHCKKKGISAYRYAACDRHMRLHIRTTPPSNVGATVVLL
jgi:hypothetical protein